jgi:hypothetical protein
MTPQERAEKIRDEANRTFDLERGVTCVEFIAAQIAEAEHDIAKEYEDAIAGVQDGVAQAKASVHFVKSKLEEVAAEARAQAFEEAAKRIGHSISHPNDSCTFCELAKAIRSLAKKD